MYISTLELKGIRCFDATGVLGLSPSCNIFVGENNAGKSTLLKGITSWQGDRFLHGRDNRGRFDSYCEITISEIGENDQFNWKPSGVSRIKVRRNLYADVQIEADTQSQGFQSGEALFNQGWPDNFLIPFSARRKTAGLSEEVSKAAQARLDGTFSNLIARLDRVANPGPPAYKVYEKNIESVLGFFVGTAASDSGKSAGTYIDNYRFLPISQMGDGVTEIAALICDLSMAEGKCFVLEEPENHLHPNGLKALLAFIRESSRNNQFIIATHSNIVVRGLADTGTKIFRVYRGGQGVAAPSDVEEIPNTPAARRDLLRELGYEFADFDLHEAWLFFEEASAEIVFTRILIPLFAPKLTGRLRTFSSGGASRVEPAISDFQRLITFVHLDSVYRDRIWVRTDGDEAGQQALKAILDKFPYLQPRAATFSKSDFEEFYPARFSEEIEQTLDISDKGKRRIAKSDRLARVLSWSANQSENVRSEWATSAAEPISVLREIESATT